MRIVQFDWFKLIGVILYTEHFMLSFFSHRNDGVKKNLTFSPRWTNTNWVNIQRYQSFELCKNFEMSPEIDVIFVYFQE